MATETNINSNETTIETNENETTPTVEELMAQLNEANARADKLKSANDKMSREIAEKKRAERATMSEAEQRMSVLEEENATWKERWEAAERENNYNKAVSAYRSIADDKMVDGLIDAVSNADHKAIATILEKITSAKVKEAQAEWQKSRPRVNMGGDGALSKEQFNAMSLAEKSKLYRENKAEYERLNS